MNASSANANQTSLADDKNRRADIQLLRGLAVGFVLIYHAKLIPALDAGYLGVDMFFVVSGFLITGIIKRSMLAGSFSFSAFYFRRAKRLLPAAYIVFAACVLAAPLFLTQLEFRDFTLQLVGAISFTGNIALWAQTGYFETAAHLKPLLHVWSLSIEEQYYLILPAMLAVAPIRLWPHLIFSLTAGSLILCLLLVESKPGATFYLLPTRAWELGLGSMGALMLTRLYFAPTWRLLFWPALAILLYLPFDPIGDSHPGMDALLVCSATLVVILRMHPLLSRGLAVRGLVWLGDISYSLYLVHWPILAFAANAWVSETPTLLRAMLVAISLLLAWILYRFVEDPIRRTHLVPSPRKVAAVVVISVLLISASFSLAAWDKHTIDPGLNGFRIANHGLNSACEYSSEYTNDSLCRVGEAPQVLLWGDSFAMHLVDGIQVHNSNGIIQATKSFCGPLAGIAATDGGRHNKSWAQGCISFNASVMQYIAANGSINVVVLATAFEQYLNHGLIFHPEAGYLAGAGEAKNRIEVVANGFGSTIDALRALGKRVVVVAPPPNGFFDIGRCLELRLSGSFALGADNVDCTLNVASYFERRRLTIDLIRKIERESDVFVIRFDDFLCAEAHCKVEIDGVPLYRDEQHLSHVGSSILGEQMRLGELIWSEAR